MRFYVFICVFVAVMVSAKKKNKRESSTSAESGEGANRDHGKSADVNFNSKGTLRKKFALEFLTSRSANNAVCSPLSALLPLGKLTLGATNKGKNELLKVIGEKNLNDMKREFKIKLHDLKYLPGVTLDIASILYVAQDSRVRSKYRNESEEVFHSAIDKVDFSQSIQAANKINTWVSMQTGGKINLLVSPNDIKKDQKLVLVNTIYFSGQWDKGFDEVYTGEFFTPTGTRNVVMMYKTDFYRYTHDKTLNAKIIEIPYEGKEASFVIVLPDTKDGLSILIRQLKLAGNLFNTAFRNMKNSKLKLSMPKFKIETQINLLPLYNTMGLSKIIHGRISYLTDIVDDDQLFLTFAIQKAVIEVNEKGAKAAAASAIGVRPVSLLILPEIHVNHPFLFYIKTKGEQLFAGVVNSPWT
ncbi:hypothetical protein K1T71_004672 [Dendrolimus kikuchii]|uniref:Uncharacterized protein n=1 Tax=Dendrolimus kikuchii TaxID=765133 RepID=A0ACC1D8D1_9NEOP|nr:hypothetical protein K1T71_004672 [Dendrolimus kikuchii]